jgi:hypothetical protein
MQDVLDCAALSSVHGGLDRGWVWISKELARLAKANGWEVVREAKPLDRWTTRNRVFLPEDVLRRSLGDVRPGDLPGK